MELSFNVLIEIAGLFSKVRFTGMFGLHMITQFDNRIVLCTNERDALVPFLLFFAI
jgi:hypothetical protein